MQFQFDFKNWLQRCWSLIWHKSTCFCSAQPINHHSYALLTCKVYSYQLISSPDVGGNHRSSLASFKAFHTQPLSVQFEEGFGSLFLLISVVSTKLDIYRSKPSTSTCTCNYLDLTKLKNILSFAASLRNIILHSSSNQQSIDFTCVPV